MLSGGDVHCIEILHYVEVVIVTTLC